MAGHRIVGALWAFMRIRKQSWLLLIVIVLPAVGASLLSAQGSALAPLIYTIAQAGTVRSALPSVPTLGEAPNV